LDTDAETLETGTGPRVGDTSCAKSEEADTRTATEHQKTSVADEPKQKKMSRTRDKKRA
jgi:hypothetical protein